ncbi:Nitrite-sensitive transcriptional repressor NsrR [Candidatus Rhodobacter oscarellae]|uniref:Nitrite-sensitive transcriptional repressor NsrR n=1 Tax=Candidatus Rhodobacter oscarellae TaxID=1675527 RepID=A0A0J9E9P8_9RHOB|nr:Nitrite-sensitive transcriptional repressor NsrR [Candidatus Rhodobacter lobularis]
MLVHLATIAPERTTASAVARLFGLSEHHVAKICSRLVQGGLLVSARGRNGGLALARPAEEITLGDAARCLAEQTALVECFGGGPCDCLILPACGLRAPLAKAQEAFYAALDGHSLAEAVRPHAGALAELFSEAD